MIIRWNFMFFLVELFFLRILKIKNKSENVYLNMFIMDSVGFGENNCKYLF